MSKLNVDIPLVQKYNVAGPRYTSYPPATKFSDAVKWPQLADEVIANNKTERDLSLYFHLPFCETLCWFCGCTTVITTKHSESREYLNYLRKELKQMASMINPKRKVTQIHLGGGTPTFFQPDELRELGAIIREHFTIAHDVEAGCEIDPRRLTREHLVALKEAGFNRGSLGVQDFDEKVQKAIHRIQPREMTEQTIRWARELGFTSLNIDLIYGLPFQTVATFENTLNQILEINPDRLAIFSYAHVPWLKPSQKILEQALPTAEQKLEILKLTTEKLTTDERYVYIGMDHFAKPTDELTIAQRNKSLHRNFQGYSTRGHADIYSFGMSAISQTENAYWQNIKEVPIYYATLDAGKVPVARGYIVTEEDKIRRTTIMRLMCDLELDFQQMSQRLGINFEEHFARELDSLSDLEGDGLLKRTPLGIEVTTTGRLFIRNIAMRFDEYLPKEGERRFSRTV
ncbi:MAG TPA: oxygen-independent coproporphyrinogen III oxidase [Candidatus Acidoferrum sp.]|nr:oxygen-independent coproporphyrinogen III oxidase [Candidatus Acidoferrum sp.]